MKELGYEDLIIPDLNNYVQQENFLFILIIIALIILILTKIFIF